MPLKKSMSAKKIMHELKHSKKKRPLKQRVAIMLSVKGKKRNKNK